MAAPACPPIEQLRALADGRLPPAELEILEPHVTGCPRCQRELEILSGHGVETLAAPGDVAHSTGAGIPAALLHAIAGLKSSPDGATSPPDLQVSCPSAAPGDTVAPSGDLALIPIGIDDSSTAQIPRQLGPVTLLREIGRGGMGVVWLARHEMLKRDVAVKFLLSASLQSDAPALAEFLAGARAASAVRHLGLTSILHADEVAGVPYLVMEHVDGPTLWAILRAVGALSPQPALAILHGIVDAISALHDAGIVHRDIKPSNVLVDVDGNTYVTDFGLACARSIGGVRVAGTPPYMAPEMHDGNVSPRTDVFALGVMSYQLLAGRLPFDGSPQQLQMRYQAAERPMQQLLEKGVDGRFVELIERAMHHNPLFRHKTARHFLNALETLDRGEARATSYLAPLVSRARGAAAEPGEKPSKPGSSYYEMLSERASLRKRSGPQTDVDPEAAPDAEARKSLGGRLRYGVTCLNCGYDLRWQHRFGRCPECGRAIEESIEPNLLFFSDVDWLRRVASGLKLWNGMLGLLFLSPFLLLFSGSPKLLLAATCTYFALIIFCLIRSVRCISTPEPGVVDPPVKQRLRTLLMISAIAMPILFAATLLLRVGLGSSPQIRFAGMVLQALTWIALLAVATVELIFVEKLIPRTRNAKLIRQFRTRRVFPWVGMLAIACVLLLIPFWFGRETLGQVISVTASCCGVMTLAIFAATASTNHHLADAIDHSVANHMNRSDLFESDDAADALVRPAASNEVPGAETGPDSVQPHNYAN